MTIISILIMALLYQGMFESMRKLKRLNINKNITKKANVCENFEYTITKTATATGTGTAKNNSLIIEYKSSTLECSKLIYSSWSSNEQVMRIT